MSIKEAKDGFTKFLEEYARKQGKRVQWLERPIIRFSKSGSLEEIVAIIVDENERDR